MICQKKCWNCLQRHKHCRKTKLNYLLRCEHKKTAMQSLNKQQTPALLTISHCRCLSAQPPNKDVWGEALAEPQKIFGTEHEEIEWIYRSVFIQKTGKTFNFSLLLVFIYSRKNVPSEKTEKSCGKLLIFFYNVLVWVNLKLFFIFLTKLSVYTETEQQPIQKKIT